MAYKYMKKFFNWLWRSSADPKKVSLTVRAAGIAAIPVILRIASTACRYGLVCLGVDAEGLNKVVDAVESIVYGGLLAIGSFGVVYGFIRKLYNTATGRRVK